MNTDRSAGNGSHTTTATMTAARFGPVRRTSLHAQRYAPTKSGSAAQYTSICIPDEWRTLT